MKLKALIAGLLTLSMVGGMVAAPSVASAQSAESRRRQQTKNEWRNLAILGGGLALIGAMNKDNTLAFVGVAGALYSLDRYEKDRKSQSRLDRQRAAYFARGYYTRNGHTYRRFVTTKNGKKYYYFRRVK